MKNLFLFLPLALLISCVPDQKPEVMLQVMGDSIIPEPQMILILADAHTIEAALLISRNRGTDTKDLANYYYAGLFSKYRISKERYQQNLAYYREDPDSFIQFYEKVNLELKEREKNFVKAPSD